MQNLSIPNVRIGYEKLIYRKVESISTLSRFVVPFLLAPSIFLAVPQSLPLRLSQSGDLFPSTFPLYKLTLSRNPMHEAETIHCRYCIQQYQKLAEGKFQTHSSYCPLHLFSSDPANQVKAFQSFFSTSQNNFMCRVNGDRVIFFNFFNVGESFEFGGKDERGVSFDFNGRRICF